MQALNNFQRVQREAAERERQVKIAPCPMAICMVSFPLNTFNTTFQGLVAAKQNDSWALAGPGEEQQQQGQSRSFSSPTPIENSKVFCAEPS